MQAAVMHRKARTFRVEMPCKEQSAGIRVNPLFSGFVCVYRTAIPLIRANARG
jgi:hypothetical protein